MTEFDPVPPPLDLPAAPDVLSPNVPLNPPMVGHASPFQHVDSENRDLILESIRTWIWRNLLPWTTSWQEQLTAWEDATEDQLNAWMVLADAYITAHAISGYSFRTTATDIAPEGTTNVTLTNVDQTFRPVVVGDLVLDSSTDSNYGIVTVVIDSTHATVVYVGSLRGLPGYSWRLTSTPIAAEDTTVVLLTADTLRPFSLGDLVLDTTEDGNFGIITALGDATHATVTYSGSLAGPAGAAGVNGLSWRYTATAIADSGTTDVTFAGSPTPPLQVGDLVGDTSGDGNYGTITVVIDDTHATVSFLGNLKGTPGADGTMHSVVAGEGISVDNTDPANPIISTVVGLFRYTDPAVMNAATSPGSPLPDGTLGSLVYGGIVSLWTVRGGIWQAPLIDFPTNVPADWATFASPWVTSSYANMDLKGAFASEVVNGTHPVFATGVKAFVQDEAYNRQVTIGSNTVGTATVNTDNSIDVTSATLVELLNLAPIVIPDVGLGNDLTDSYEVRVWGQLAANGEVTFQFSNGVEIDDSAANYTAFGETVQMAAGVLTHDDDYIDFYNDGFWTLATDTTNSPTYVDIVFRVYHAHQTEWPVIAYYESVYYTTPFSGAGMQDMFKRKGTCYHFNGPDTPVLSGGAFNFSEAFTGWIQVRAL